MAEDHSVRDDALADLEEQAAVASYALRDLIRRAYNRGLERGLERGMQEGAAKMRDAIMRAAGAPVEISTFSATESMRSGALSKRRSERALKGAVRSAIVEALQREPGIDATRIGVIAAQLDSSVSPRSVGGELRRFKGKLYRQVGKKWFLVGEAAQTQKETAGSDHHAVSQHPAQENSVAPETPIAS